MQFETSVEFRWIPSLLAALLTFVCGAFSIQVVNSLPLFLLGAFVGGAAGAIGCEFYDSPANNGAVGAAIAVVATFPLTLGYAYAYTPIALGDSIFAAVAVFFGFLFAFLLPVVFAAYCGGMCADMVRRRAPQPVGY